MKSNDNLNELIHFVMAFALHLLQNCRIHFETAQICRLNQIESTAIKCTTEPRARIFGANDGHVNTYYCANLFFSHLVLLMAWIRRQRRVCKKQTRTKWVWPAMFKMAFAIHCCIYNFDGCFCAQPKWRGFAGAIQKIISQDYATRCNCSVLRCWDWWFASVRCAPWC